MSGTQQATYIINQGDTLESIAYKQLGSMERWREIAALNKLRYPFISSQPADWYGPVIALGLLSNEVGAGSIEIKVAGESREKIVPNSFFFVDGYLTPPEGAQIYIWEALEVAQYDPNIGVIFLKDKTQYGWRPGTRYRIFPPARDLVTQVASVGQRLVLPLDVPDDGNIATDARVLYGTDILLGDIKRGKGRPVLVDGDLAVVSGHANVAQALWMRTMLPYGTYLVHPNEGNRMFDLLGGNVYPETAFIAASFLQEALMTDPRVAEVTELSVSVPEADSIMISATVRLEGSAETITFNETVRQRRGVE